MSFKIGDKVRIKQSYPKDIVESWSSPYPEIWRTARIGIITKQVGRETFYVDEWGTSQMYAKELELVPNKPIVVIHTK